MQIDSQTLSCSSRIISLHKQIVVVDVCVKTNEQAELLENRRAISTVEPITIRKLHSDQVVVLIIAVVPNPWCTLYMSCVFLRVTLSSPRLPSPLLSSLIELVPLPVKN